MVLPLKKDVLYGPVNSRRYGRSLGINLSPRTYKLCSFNCVYCHYGLTNKCTLDVAPYAEDLPSLDTVVRELTQTLQTPLELDQITFSGNGEPTLHPQFAPLVEAVVELRDRFRPSARVALLSNATGLRYQKVRRSIGGIDLPVFKLDAGTPAMFRAMNRPARSVTFAELVEFLCGMNGIYLQTVFTEGKPCNCSSDELAAYSALLRRIRPKEVHVYSIDRPVPQADISLVPPQRLTQIATQLEHETGVCIRAYCGG